jgi:hypothetical protein
MIINPSTGRRALSGFPKGAFKSDLTYAEVDSRWLGSFHNKLHKDFISNGIVDWEDSFDCSKFAAAYCAAAQMEYYKSISSKWKSGMATALGVGEIWYVTPNGRGHAVVLVLSDVGSLYIDPQTGKIVELTPEEEKSIYFARF